MQMFSLPFLAMQPSEYFCKENGTEQFGSLHQWSHFANPVLVDGALDLCQVYDLDYVNLELDNISNSFQLTNKTRACVSWVFQENEETTLITEVSLQEGILAEI